MVDTLILQKIVGILQGIVMLLSTGAVGATDDDLTLGAFNQAAGGTYRLQTSVGTTDTTIRLSSFKEPVTNNLITMTSLNSDIGYATIDPQSSTRKEFISFTGITQNADNSATLSGVTRGLAFQYPFTASTTLRKSHPGQSILILSDSPQVFEEFAKKRSNETITGQWTFDTFPIAQSTSSNATATTTGNIELATGQEAASSTRFGDFGPLVIPAAIATSSYSTTSKHVIPVTRTDGILPEGFVASSTKFSVTGTSTFSGALVGVGGNIIYASSSATTTSGIATTTMYTFTLPASTMSLNGGIHIRGIISEYDGDQASPSYPKFVLSYGGTNIVDIRPGANASQDLGDLKGSFDIYLRNNASTTSQFGFGSMNVGDSGIARYVISSDSGTSGIDSTANQTVILRAIGTSGNAKVTIDGLLVTLLK